MVSAENVPIAGLALLMLYQLKKYLAPNDQDIPIIKKCKAAILANISTRYTKYDMDVQNLLSMTSLVHPSFDDPS